MGAICQHLLVGIFVVWIAGLFAAETFQTGPTESPQEAGAMTQTNSVTTTTDTTSGPPTVPQKQPGRGRSRTGGPRRPEPPPLGLEIASVSKKRNRYPRTTNETRCKRPFPLRPRMNSDGSYICTCDTGYELSDDGISCIDFDECTVNPSSCDSVNGMCMNSVGSYICSCNSGYELNDDGIFCNDIDECTVNPSSCDSVNGMCINSVGSYICSCNSGYEISDDGITCNDIDECTVNPSSCDSVNRMCINSVGSYICSCNSGYELGDNGITCNDIDECTVNPSSCDSVNEMCINSAGSYICLCNFGYEIGDDGITCNDIDECTVNPSSCNSVNEMCINSVGSYICSCNSGYELGDDGITCNAEIFPTGPAESTQEAKAMTQTNSVTTTTDTTSGPPTLPQEQPDIPPMDNTTLTATDAAFSVALTIIGTVVVTVIVIVLCKKCDKQSIKQTQVPESQETSFIDNRMSTVYSSGKGHYRDEANTVPGRSLPVYLPKIDENPTYKRPRSLEIIYAVPKQCKPHSSGYEVGCHQEPNVLADDQIYLNAPSCKDPHRLQMIQRQLESDA